MQTGGVQDDQAGAGLEGTARVSLSNSSLTGQAPKLNRVGKTRTKAWTDMSSGWQVLSLLWWKKERRRRRDCLDLDPNLGPSLGHTQDGANTKPAASSRHLCLSLSLFTSLLGLSGPSLCWHCPPSLSPHTCPVYTTTGSEKTVPGASAPSWESQEASHTPMGNFIFTPWWGESCSLGQESSSSPRE